MYHVLHFTILEYVIFTVVSYTRLLLDFLLFSEGVFVVGQEINWQ